VSPYIAILSARYRTMLQYRAAAAAGVFTQVFWGAVRLMILEAFYLSSDATQPMSWEAVAAYVWLGQAMLALLPWGLDPEIEDQIRRGNVVYELVRPLDLYNLWFARTAAMRVSRATLRVIPIAILGGVILPLSPIPEWTLLPPESVLSFALFALAIVNAILISTALTMLIHASMLWTIAGDGVLRLVPALVNILSGSIVPLPLFPEWLQPTLRALPFRALVDVPFRLWSGDIPPSEAGWDLFTGALWAFALIGLGRFLVARGKRRMVAQGG